ncbi:MAG: DNA polymerase III subunit alpha [Candidatus Anoxychlamydiales bacterium]|nr:DNA polymerase III subunit alpha [Candidatus Anoxychlamydiales bacterium]
MSWISLHNHSRYSILDSTIEVKKLAKLAKENDMNAIALTDSYNMCGVIEFYKACIELDIKPIIGCEIWVANGSRFEKKRRSNSPMAHPLVLLVKNEIGYKNLCMLSSKGYTEGFYYYPRIDKELLKEHSEGLICLSGPANSSLSHKILNSSEEEIEKEISWFLDVFKDDFYLEVALHEMSDENIDTDQMKKEAWVLQKLTSFVEKEKKLKDELIKYSNKHNIKCVATNDVHYEKRADWKGHEILLNIASNEACEIWERDSKGIPRYKVPNPKRKTYPSHEYYFKSPTQMKKRFEGYENCLENSIEIADKCSFSFDFKAKYYPVFYPPNLKDTDDRAKKAEEYLLKLCMDAIELRYTEDKIKFVKEKFPNEDPKDIINKRLKHEFELISSKGMCDYFLIVYDFISWAKNKNIPVGPGRGSAAGSIISYLIGITDIEPLRFNLFFERFINPERIAYPDIDVDICMERRSEVIDYTVQKYGKEKVAQIITFGTMKAKMAIKDVGRVLSVPLSHVNIIAKLVPEDPNMTLEKAIEIDPELKQMYEKDEDAKRIIDIAKTIEGSIRNTSTHAAGIIISAKPLTDNIPICIAKDSEMAVTQFSMKPVEAVGLLKIDFLGLKTLTCIQKACALVEKNTERKIDWENLPLDDKPTFDLLNKGKTLGVFQLESGGIQDLAKHLHIDVFEEIIAVEALYRPGPMDMIPSFIKRKHGKEKIEIDHPLMKDILKETYGVMIYQEQVMQIASTLAGYSLGEGDVLRRAMGKKDHVEMMRQRQKFVKGAKKNGIDENISENIFNKIEKFASYGFNKSHATAYAFISYVTAFFKANYTKEWLAALMTCDRYDLSKVAKFIRECKSLNIAILPPSVNEAEDEFISTKDGIRFAMSAIKGIGSNVVEAIVKERNKNGPYKNLFDFIKRVDKSRVGKKNIELLIASGGFDFCSWTRAEMKISVEKMYDQATKEQEDKEKGVMNLFSLLKEEKDNFSVPPKISHQICQIQKLLLEKELLGFYLTGHPMDKYQNILKRLSSVPLKDLEKFEKTVVVRSAFVIDEVKYKISKAQRKFAILTISDGMERYELPIWPELYLQKTSLLKENQLVYAILQVERVDETLKLQCKWLEDLSLADDKMIKVCDDAYDKIKNKVSNYEFRKKRNGFMKDKSSEKKESNFISNIKIRLNANAIRFSQILEIKNLFKSNPGKTAVELEFFNETQKIGLLEISSNLKINFHADFKNKILNIAGIEEVISG